MDIEERILFNEIREELKWHSKQNEKIIELLGKTKKPCGADKEKMARVINRLSQTLQGSRHAPIFSEILKEVAKDGD